VVDVGVEFVGGDLAAAADVDRCDLMRVQEFVELGAADTERGCGFGDGVQQRLGGGRIRGMPPLFR
jgi:hypothetical protein